MAQKVTLNVAGMPYVLNAETPEMERMMRLAAAEVNEMLVRFDARFPTSSTEDKLRFVAVQEAVGKLAAQQQAECLREEAALLERDLTAYLEGIEK